MTERLMAKMLKSGYEFFGHTADIGIRAHAPTQAQLFIAMAQGLMALIIEDTILQPATPRAIHLTASDVESLLLKWLQELLFWFSTERFVAVQYVLDELTKTTLRGTVRGETFHPKHHAQGREVKAITRHLLEMWEDHGVWHAQVVVDI